MTPRLLALRGTLVLLLLQPVGAAGLRPAIALLAAAGLLLPRVLEHAGLWLALAALTGWRVVGDWPLSDNHAYLLAYWCLAAALATLASRPDESLARSARSLVGLAFAFAAVWKLALSPDYLDGSFFRVLLTGDERFASLTLGLGGLDLPVLEANRRFLAGGVGSFQTTPAFERLAALSTWGIVLLEAALAVAFLWPSRRGPGRWRDALLLAFCALTFAVAPVPGFGWLLLAMGCAACEAARPGTQAAYGIVFALILVYREWPGLGWLLGA